MACPGDYGNVTIMLIRNQFRDAPMNVSSTYFNICVTPECIALHHSCNKCCNLIGQQQVSKSHRVLVNSHRVLVNLHRVHFYFTLVYS